MNTIHHDMVRDCERNGETVLVAGIASAMIRPGDTEETVFTCWWMALKYECVEVEFLDDILGRIRLRSLTKESIYQCEAEVLSRLGWIIPHRNPICEAFESAGKQDAELDRWLFRIVFLRMDRAAEGEGGWWAVLEPLLSAESFPPLCQTVVFQLPKRMLTRLMKRLRYQRRLRSGREVS